VARISTLVVADPPSAWASLGFCVEGDGTVVGGVSHHLDPSSGHRGITQWEVAGIGLDGRDLDGLPTRVVESPSDAAAPVSHRNGVVAIDHLVIATPDHERTVAAFEAAGLQLLRTRRTDTYGAPMVQGFFRLGPVIVEVIGQAGAVSEGPARFFGLALTVTDLDATARYLGSRLHPAKDAVQPGRRIATLDRGAGVRTALAFMSP
jgi:hypothetical protein